MTRFTKWAFGNKAAIAFTTFLALVVGIVSYFTIPMELLPAADNPQITISTVANGYDAKSAEENITSKIEKAVSNVKGKKNILSTTGDGFSQVNMMFDSNTNMKDAKQEVQEALNSVMLPSNVKPYVLLLNTSMIPIAEVGLTFKDGLTSDNLKKVENDIEPMFKSIKGVGSVQILGTNKQQIKVKVDQAKLQQLQIPAQALAAALQGKNLSMAIGEQTVDGTISNLKVIGSIESLDDLKNLQVVPKVKVSDIATVELDKNTKTITRLNGNDFVEIMVTKDATSNAVAVGKDITKTIQTVNEKFGPNAQATMLFLVADMVSNSVNSMTKEVLMGALFATIVILLFLRSIRITFITVVSIPLSLCITVFLLAQSGITLNILTLGGIAVAVGRLVDDSIVVIENIYRRAKKEPISTGLIIDSVKEVSTAITSSTLTTICVFLPIGLVSGGLRNFLLPFALSITYSLVASLVVAVTLVPLMSSKLLKNIKPTESHKQSVWYPKVLKWSLNHKWVPIVLTVAMIGVSVGLFANLPKGSIDQADNALISVTLDYPANTPFEKMKDEALKLEKYLVEQPEVKHVAVIAGHNEEGAKWGQVGSSTQVQLSLILKDDVNSIPLLERIRAKKEEFKDADLIAQGASFTPSAGATVTVDVLGNKFEDIKAASQKIESELKNVDGVLKVESNQNNNKNVFSINVDAKTANPQEIGSTMQMMLNPMPIGSIKVNGDETAVILEPMHEIKKAADLNNLPVATKTGVTTLDKVAKITNANEPTTIYSKDGQMVIKVTAEVDPKKAIDVGTAIQTKVSAMTLPDGIKTDIGGSSQDSSSDLMDMARTMLVSIGIVFLIMLITFKTFRAPLAILVSLPLAAVGALFGLAITKTGLDISAAIGMLMLIGIVVTNAIVLIDRVKHNEQSMTIRDSLMEAGSVRVRPILMTAIATVFAMLPLVFAKAEMGSLVGKGLAIVVISGLTFSTLLTLIVIPVIYELLHFRKSKKQRLGTDGTLTTPTTNSITM